MGPSLAVEGGTTKAAVFEAHVGLVLAPSLSSGEEVVVMDNLSAHKGDRVRELVEEARGCEVSPIAALILAGLLADGGGLLEAQGAATRAPQARTKETLLEEIWRALEAITPEDDVRGWFSHCGYAVAQSL